MRSSASRLLNLQPESDFFKVEQTLDFPAFQVAAHNGKYRLCEVGQEYPAERLFHRAVAVPTPR